MDVAVSVVATDAADELRSLYGWLTSDTELRGRVRLVEHAPRPGVLGLIPELLTVAGPGVGTALATVLIAWIRHRTSDLACKLTRPDGTVIDITARRVRGRDLVGQQELVRELAASLEAGEVRDESRPADR